MQMRREKAMMKKLSAMYSHMMAVPHEFELTYDQPHADVLGQIGALQSAVDEFDCDGAAGHYRTLQVFRTNRATVRWLSVDRGLARMNSASRTRALTHRIMFWDSAMVRPSARR